MHSLPSFQDFFSSDAVQRGLHGTVPDRLRNQDVGKLLAGAAKLKIAVPHKLLNEV